MSHVDEHSHALPHLAKERLNLRQRQSAYVLLALIQNKKWVGIYPNTRTFYPRSESAYD